MLRHAELPVWQIVLNYAKTHDLGGRYMLHFFLSKSSSYNLSKVLVRAGVVNLLVVCSIVNFEDFVSQFQLLKQTYSASVDVLNVRYFFKKDVKS